MPKRSQTSSKIPSTCVGAPLTTRYVLANDLSPSACEAMRMNVTYNGVQEPPADQSLPGQTDAAQNGNAPAAPIEYVEEQLTHGRRPGCKGKVRVTEGDAWYVSRVPVLRADPTVRSCTTTEARPAGSMWSTWIRTAPPHRSLTPPYLVSPTEDCFASPAQTVRCSLVRSIPRRRECWVFQHTTRDDC